jgi:L-2-hydroxyglutarate oxidase LhgO
MADRVECLVVGAGVIGLAVARQLALIGHQTLLLESRERFGTQISGRNSEVIHAGLHHPQYFLKAQLCRRGRDLLYDYCAGHGVSHRRCGKLVVAQAGQEGELERLAAQAQANGVDDLQLLDGAQARRLEPELRCAAALLSPASGIVDAQAYMLSLLGEAQSHGVQLALLSPVTALRLVEAGIEVFLDGQAEPQLEARWVVNCAGLDAPGVARCVEGFPEEQVPRQWYAKGSYFSLTGRAPFSHLIYPLPEAGGLGIHLTLDLAGQGRFGPDVEWVDVPDYTVNPGRMERFEVEVRGWWPGLPEERLAPAYAGIRPRLSGPGEAVADFMIQGPQAHGLPGIVNLFGIESPGLTASLAIAERVGALIK